MMAAGSEIKAVNSTSRGRRRTLTLLCALCTSDVATLDVEYDRELQVESAPLFGNMDKYAYYFTDLLVGSPDPQKTTVIVDTGSRLVGFPCNECSHCGSHIEPAYNTSRSRSLSWKNCSSNCSTSCSKEQHRCPYKESYAEGSEISGFWFEDLVELGDAFSKNPPVRVTLGCHTNENKLFYSQRANGIMGLAATSDVLNRPSFLEAVFKDTRHVKKEVFSICLAAWGGRLNIGGYNSSYHIKDVHDGGSITWVKMHAQHYYYIEPTGMSVGGRSLVEAENSSASFGYTIVDSGTTLSYFPEAVFRPLTKALDMYCEQHGINTQVKGSQCWQMNSSDAIVAFPPIRFEFRETHITWWPESYLHHSQGQMWCLAFQESDSDQTVLGISFMLHKDFVFDLAGGRLGVADAQCPEHREPPEIEQKFSTGPAAPRLGAGMRFGGPPAAEATLPHLPGATQPAAQRLAALGAAAAAAAASLAALRARWWSRAAPFAQADEQMKLHPCADA